MCLLKISRKLNCTIALFCPHWSPYVTQDFLIWTIKVITLDHQKKLEKPLSNPVTETKT